MNNNKIETLDQTKKRVQELMPNISIIGDNGQFLVVKDLQKDGTFDYGLSENFDLANSEIEAWQQAGTIITDNLGKEELYKETFIIDISDKARKIHFDYLNEVKENYQNDISFIINSYPDGFDTSQEIKPTQDALNNIRTTISNAERTIMETNTDNIQPIIYQNLHNNPFVLIVDEINIQKENNELSLMNDNQLENIAKPMLEKDIAMLKFNNGHFAITQSLTTGEIKPINLKDLHVLKPKQVLSYMKENYPTILNELEKNIDKSHSLINDLNTYFGDIQIMKPEELVNTAFIYHLSLDELTAQKDLLIQSKNSNTPIDSLPFRYNNKEDYYNDSIDKVNNLIKKYNSTPKELDPKINELSFALKEQKETLIALKTISFQNDDDWDMMHHTEGNILNLQSELLFTHKALLNHKYSMIKTIDFNDLKPSKIEADIENLNELKLEMNTIEHYIDQSKELYNTLGFDDLDFDNDGLTNAEEISLGTSIYNSDTDGNGITDVNEPSKLPQGTAFRIVEDENDGSFKIEKSHKILKWIKVRPSKKNGIEKTSGLTKDQAFETYTKMQTLDIEQQNQKKGKGFKL